MSRKLSTYQSLAYALPVITANCLMAPLGVVQGIYAKYFGLSLTSIAMVLLIARLFDAVTDPIVGYYSDRHHHRTGTYKPFILLGGFLFAVSSYFLYAPPVDVTITYFTLWFLAFYATWTIFEVPHIAWASQLAITSEEKAKIYSFRASAAYVGLALFYAIPLLPIFESQAITPATLKVLAIVAGILMLPLLLICLKIGNTTGDNPVSRPVVAYSTQPSLGMKHSILRNTPLLIFIGAIMLTVIATGLWYSLLFLYVDVFLGIGEHFAKVSLLALLLGLVSVPLWCRLALWLGKKPAWLLAACLTISAYIYTGTLTPESVTILTLIILMSLLTLGLAGINALVPAVLSEIVDFSHWKYHNDQNALYFSIYTFFNKTVSSVATALGLGVAGWYGFDATTSVQSDQSIFGLTLMICWLPILFATLSLVFILVLPINERRHRIIRRRLDLREKRFSRHIISADSAASFSSAGSSNSNFKPLSITND